MVMKKPKPKAESKPNRAPEASVNVPFTTEPVGQRLFYAGAAIAFLLSLVIYSMTMGRSAAFWDAGEFIASS